MEGGDQMKRIRAVVSLVVCIFVLMHVLAASAQAVEMSLQYVNTRSVTVDLVINGEIANCTAYVRGLSGTTHISISMSLERRNSNGSYTTIKTWPTESANGATCSVAKIYAVLSGYTYRVCVQTSVTRNGSVENITEYSAAVAT
jgi:hypothetical protein